MTHHVLLGRAREMRQEMATCEERLWARLRNRQLADAKFRRQAPIGPFIADFACVEARLVVEIDGDSHGTDEQETKDARRTEWFQQNGWRVIRFWTSEVSAELDWVIDRIWEETTGKTTPP